PAATAAEGRGLAVQRPAGLEIRLVVEGRAGGERPPAGPDLVQRGGGVESAVLHHVQNRPAVRDVLERVRVEDDQIRELPRLDAPQVLTEPDRLGAEDGRHPEHVVLGEPARLYRPEL